MRIYEGCMSNTPDNTPHIKKLSPAAKRALAEAKARQDKRASELKSRQNEKGGPSGAEPTRYGDWERGGIAYDF